MQTSLTSITTIVLLFLSFVTTKTTHERIDIPSKYVHSFIDNRQAGQLAPNQNLKLKFKNVGINKAEAEIYYEGGNISHELKNCKITHQVTGSEETLNTTQATINKDQIIYNLLGGNMTFVPSCLDFSNNELKIVGEKYYKNISFSDPKVNVDINNSTLFNYTIDFVDDIVPSACNVYLTDDLSKKDSFIKLTCKKYIDDDTESSESGGETESLLVQSKRNYNTREYTDIECNCDSAYIMLDKELEANQTLVFTDFDKHIFYDKVNSEFTSDTGLSGGEIAGIVIGVLALLGLLGGVGYFVYKKKSG